jgi:peptidoglycan/LPS O-acetylase OafA/YrhL
VPVLCSIGCRSFLALGAGFGAPYAQAVAVLVTVVASLAAAYPLTLINEWWVTRLNRIVETTAPRAAAPRAPG